MKRRHKRSTAVLIAGVVHAIGDTKQPEAFDDRTISSPSFRRRQSTRAQRKAQRLREQANPLVRLACETPRWGAWHDAPRTHAAVTCMTCLVVMARRDR